MFLLDITFINLMTVRFFRHTVKWNSLLPSEGPPHQISENKSWNIVYQQLEIVYYPERIIEVTCYKVSCIFVLVQMSR